MLNSNRPLPDQLADVRAAIATLKEKAIFDACSKTTEVTRVYLHKKGRSK